MGYRVHFLIKGDYTSEDFPKARNVDVKQNHLYIYDSLNDIIAVYQSGWWIKVHKIEND